MRSQSVRVLVALALGLALGLTLGMLLATGSEAATQLVAVADVVGTPWTNAIRMTVIPPVLALTIASVTGTGATTELRRAMGRAFVVFAVLLLAGGEIGIGSRASASTRRYRRRGCARRSSCEWRP